MGTTIKLNWEYAKGEFDIDEIRMLCLPARGKRMFGSDELDAELCIKDGWNLKIADIRLGDVESSNLLCEEIARRWNKFPKYHESTELPENGRTVLCETEFGHFIAGPNHSDYNEFRGLYFNVKRWVYTDEIFAQE